MEWIGKIIIWILALLVGSLLFLLGLHFVNDLFHFWPVYVDSIKPCDKFEVFRDLLIILLTTVGIVGYFSYKQIRNKLLESLSASNKENDTYFQSRLHDLLAYIHYREYEDIIIPHEDKQLWSKKFLDLAIDEARNAVSFAEELDETKYKGKVNTLRMNLAYHLSARGNQEDKGEALKLVEENFIEAIKHRPAEEYNFRETRAWVILKCSDKEDKKEEVKKDLRDLLKQTNLSNDWKNGIYEKYSNIFGISLNNSI